MEISISKLRQNIYNIIDKVLESGVPVYIKRRGRIVKISVEGDTQNKLDSFKGLPRREIVKGDPDEIIHMDWLNEWREDI